MKPLESIVFTDKGDRETNDDYDDEISFEHGYCAILADGCGAYGSGDLAAKLFCTHFLTGLEKNPPLSTDHDAITVIQNLIEISNTQLG